MDLETGKRIVREAGERLLAMSEIQIEEKTDYKNLVTSCDKATQEFLVGRFREQCPAASFLCEEGGEQRTDGDPLFVIDPIDGTTNFIKRYNQSAISVACAQGEKVRWGIVYNPYTQEMFWAQRGEGAFLNGKGIRVNGDDLKHSIVSFGTSPYNPEYKKRSFEIAYDLMDHCMDIRRSGAASLDLCYVADGRCGLYFERILSPWDFAAGLCIAEEAGGTVCTWDRKYPDHTQKSGIIAGNHKTVAQFLQRYAEER